MSGVEKNSSIERCFFNLSLESTFYFERRSILTELKCQSIEPGHGSPALTIENALKNGYISSYEYDCLMDLYSNSEVFPYD